MTPEQCEHECVLEIDGFVNGYVAQDGRCVHECSDIYTIDSEEDRTCKCKSHLAPNGKGCVAECDST